MAIKKKRPQRKTRVEDVAREAGVSPITVSRALSNPALVRPETRQKVADAVAKTGYVIDSFASSLRSGRSSLIVLFVSNLQNPQYAGTIQGFTEALEGNRYSILMAPTDFTDVLQPEMIDPVLAYRPAAFAFVGMVQSSQTRAKIKEHDVPVIEMWDFSADPVDMLVGSSNAEGGRLVGDYFGSRGFRHIVYAGRTQDRGAQRLAGFRDGLSRYRKKPDYVLSLEGPRDADDGATAFEYIRREVPNCDAILFGSDILAAGALRRARELKVPVPQEVAIAGYGDLEMSEHLFTPLTTVRVDSYEIGFAAGEMLLKRLNEEPLDQKILRVPIELEIRASTGG